MDKIHSISPRPRSTWRPAQLPRLYGNPRRWHLANAILNVVFLALLLGAVYGAMVLLAKLAMHALAVLAVAPLVRKRSKRKPAPATSTADLGRLIRQAADNTTNPKTRAGLRALLGPQKVKGEIITALCLVMLFGGIALLIGATVKGLADGAVIQQAPPHVQPAGSARASRA